MRNYRKKTIDKEKAIRMYTEGAPLTHVAFALGVSTQTITNRFDKWGVKRRANKGVVFWREYNE